MNVQTPSRLSGMGGVGDIVRGAFIVPQNPVKVGMVLANSNPVTIRRSTGTSGIGILRRLQGLGQCDPTDVVNYDPVACAAEGAALAASGGTGSSGAVNTNTGSFLQVMPGDYQPLSETLPGLNLTFPQGTVATQQPAGYTGQLTYPPGVTPPPAPGGYQWAQVLNQSGQAMAQVLAVAQGGASLRLPNGATMMYGSPQSALVAGAGGALGGALGTTIGTVSPVMVIVGLAVVLMIAMGGRGR